MSMSNDRQLVSMSLVGHCFHFLHRHLILIDQFDDVNSGIRQLFHFRPRVGRALNAPPKVLGPRIRFMLDEWAGDIQSWPRNFAAVDTVAKLKAFLKRTTEITGAGDAGHEQTVSSCRHDFRAEPCRIRMVPMLIVLVAHRHRAYLAML